MKHTVWTNGIFVEDNWVSFEEGVQVEEDMIITLADWQSGKWTDHAGRLALSVEASDDIKAIADVLDYFDMVVVNFPAFANGTAFSIARLIRDKYNYQHDIRARGAFILDQMPLLERCGVTSFEISSPLVKAGLKRGAWPNIPRYYQHALDGDRISYVDQKRPWLSVVDIDGNLKSTRTAA